MAYSRTDFTDTCEDNKGYLYIIECYNETEKFFKIGITKFKDILKRFNSATTMPYEFNVIKIYESLPSIVYDLETKLIQIGKPFSYTPLISFSGQHECISVIDDVISYMEDMSYMTIIKDIHYKKKEKIKKVSITRQVQEWEGLCNDCIENKNDKLLYDECLKACETFLQDYPNFNEWLESGVTTSNMKTLGFNKDKIIEEAFKKRTLQHNKDNVDVLLKFEIGAKYTFDEKKKRIQLFYDKLGIGKKAKSTDIKNWYDVHQTSVYNQGKSIQAFKILSKKQ